MSVVLPPQLEHDLTLTLPEASYVKNDFGQFHLIVISSYLLFTFWRFSRIRFDFVKNNIDDLWKDKTDGDVKEKIREEFGAEVVNSQLFAKKCTTEIFVMDTLISCEISRNSRQNL